MKFKYLHNTFFTNNRNFSSNSELFLKVNTRTSKFPLFSQIYCFITVEVRLVGGSSANEGRVEIRLGNGQWGTVCDDSFDINDANVVCRQLGYEIAASYEGSAYFGQGNGSIWLDDVECDGDEETLLDCSSDGWSQHNCGHYEDVGVVCLGKVFLAS